MNTRVQGAILLGIALVASALVVGRYLGPAREPVASATPSITQPLQIESTLRQPIPIVDTNDDGVPDWQELLNQTEPLELDEPETFTPPETLTDQFALEFFETIMRNEGFGALGRSPDVIIDSASDAVLAQVEDKLFTERDITVVAENNSEALRAYANLIALIIDNARLPLGTRNELTIVEDAVNQNDASILTELDPIVANYSGIITYMQEVPVPQIMVKEHLDLLNAMQAIRNDIAAMQLLFADPLVALLRVQRYQDDVVGLGITLRNVFEKPVALGVRFEPDDAVFRVYNFE